MTTINTQYVLKVIHDLQGQGTTTNDSLFTRIKFGMPGWLRKIVFGPVNIFYVYYLFLKDRRDKKIIFEAKHIYFSIDFVLYSLQNQVSLDSRQYFPIESDRVELIRFVRNRIKSCFRVKLLYNELYCNPEIVSEIKKKQDKIFRFLGRNRYEWNLDGHKLVVPNIPEPSCYYFQQGVPFLPKFYSDKLKNKLFLSVGAFWGDTAISLLTLNPDQIWCFEPEKKNFEKLNQVIELNKLTDKIRSFRIGIGESNGFHSVSSEGGSSMLKETGEERVVVKTLDSFIESFPKEVGFIKMDIEGWEYFALQGAVKLIQKYKPVLSISLYHTGRDFYEIPPMIKKICPEYHFRFLNLAPEDLNEKILLAYIADE